MGATILADVATTLAIVLPIVGLVIGAAAGILIYIVLMRNKIGKSKQLANKMVEEAISEAKTLRRDAIAEGRAEVQKEKNVFENEMKERAAEAQKTEQRLLQRESSIDKKESMLEKKEANLDAKLEGVEQTKANLAQQQEELNIKKSEINAAHEKMVEALEKVAGLSKEDAKQQLIDSMEDEAKRDAAKIVREIEQKAKDEGDRRAKEVVALAIQKCAVDHSSEITVSTVTLPNDEMKGRIIGREGRNIKALEQATGVDFIIDDTPDTVVLSAFDPVRREIARVTLEKLISDGRIHPGRIEDIVAKATKEIDVQIKEAGENAMFETGVFNLHPEEIKLLGRMKFRTSYGQNVLKHSIEVSYLAGNMAGELGANVMVCKRAGLLHDIGKSIDHETEGTHISIGVDIAKKYKESEEVIHCIAAHHNDIEPKTLEAILVQCADAISGSRPGARRESLENYVKRLEQLENIANSHAGVEKSYAIQAGREVRIIVKPEVVDDAATVFLARDIAKQIENEMQYPGQIKVNVIRELRSVDYAK